MGATVDYLVGVDGGGTKTLVRVVHRDGRLLGQASGPGSALRNGSAPAWATILSILAQVFEQARLAMPAPEHLAVGIGIAGYNVAPWAEQFMVSAPAFAVLQAASDGMTTLLGAHQGAPGAVIAVGTGTIGVAVDIDGHQRVVDGWGFPSGDDASGAWMGLRAIHHAQQAIDGRALRGILVDQLLVLCAAELPRAQGAARSARETVLDWLAQADQAAFARLARLVVAHVDDDRAARAIVLSAAAEIELMAQALDPRAVLPLALCGGLAMALQPHLPAPLRQRIVAPLDDAAAGALLLARRAMPIEGPQGMTT